MSYDLIYKCDRCGKRYEYLDMMPSNGSRKTHRDIGSIQPLKIIAGKEYCRTCCKIIEVAISAAN